MIALRLISCLACLAAAIAVFLVCVFQQTNAMSSEYSSPALFLIDIGLFALATYQGVLIHDRLMAQDGRGSDDRTT